MSLKFSFFFKWPGQSWALKWALGVQINHTYISEKKNDSSFCLGCLHNNGFELASN